MLQEFHGRNVTLSQDLDEYIKTERGKIEIEYKKFPEHTKSRMLLRSICYYMIEKKYITNIPEEHTNRVSGVCIAL